MRRNAKSENYLHITDKSERGRRALVVASQTVGVLAECRPPRRPFSNRFSQKLQQNFSNVFQQLLSIINNPKK